MEMEENHDNPLQIHRMLQTNIVEVTKKRKLLGKQLDLPISKHRFRDRGSVTEDLSPYVVDLEKVFNTFLEKELVSGETRLERHDSARDSTSSVGDSDFVMSQHTEANSRPHLVTVYTYDQPANSEPNSPKANAHIKPSTSSGSCGSNSPKNMYHPFSNISTENTITEEEPQCPKDKKSPCTEYQQHPGLEEHSDCINNEIEECVDDESNMMLYSNGVTSDLFVLSSGRWEVNPDIPQRPRKPTIDQEFEEYFSTLML